MTPEDGNPYTKEIKGLVDKEDEGEEGAVEKSDPKI